MYNENAEPYARYRLKARTGGGKGGHVRLQLVQKLERTSTEVNEARGPHSCSRTRVIVEKEVTRNSRMYGCVLHPSWGTTPRNSQGRTS